MVKIPDRDDPTILAINKVLEDNQKPYISKNIGFGEIGHDCDRYLYNKINAETAEIFTPETLRIFRAGHKDEADMAADLRLVEGVTLYTHDPNRDNKQYKADALGGRFTGRIDGVIVGLKQAPATPHAWEHKHTSDKKFDELIKLKNKFDEKLVLREWSTMYFGQAQSVMKHFELDRHYMTISTPGLRRVTSLRTDFNKEYADALEAKAERIINAKHAPERIGGPDWYQCKYCRFWDKCHGNK